MQRVKPGVSHRFFSHITSASNRLEASTQVVLHFRQGILLALIKRGALALDACAGLQSSSDAKCEGRNEKRLSPPSFLLPFRAGHVDRIRLQWAILRPAASHSDFRLVETGALEVWHVTNSSESRRCLKWKAPSCSGSLWKKDMMRRRVRSDRWL